jgi:hypothetical protein
MEWIEVYIECRITNFTTSNIEGGWRDAGLSPFNPQKTLRKVISTRLLIKYLRRPPFTPIPFHQVISSPPDPLNLRCANAASTHIQRTLSNSRKNLHSSIDKRSRTIPSRPHNSEEAA